MQGLKHAQIRVSSSIPGCHCGILRSIDTLFVADVCLDSRTAGAQATYTYSASRDLAPKAGEAYFVPLGPRRAIGFVTQVREVAPNELGFAANLLKPLGAKIEGLDLPPAVLGLVFEVSRQTLSPVPVALGLAVPPSVKERLVTTWSPRSEAIETANLSTAQQEVLRVMAESGEIVDDKTHSLPDSSKKSLRALEKKGLVRQSVSLSSKAERHRMTGLYRLNPDSDQIERFLEGVGKKRPAQAVTLMRLQGSESASFSVQEIKSLGAVTDQTIKALIGAGLLQEAAPGSTSTKAPPSPNRDQVAAIQEIVEAVQANLPSQFLLFGITGSGKTEVYLRCASEALKQGRQVLYLVPEIALTAQVIAQLRERFGDLVAVVHSNMSPSERLDNWLKIKNKQCPVVLGPRSAIFSPLTDCGLIIVDEEHETSYKQDSSPRYQTKTLVEFMGREFSCPIVFGSATPSLETYHAAKSDDVKLLSLPNRTASAQLPDIEVVNLVELYKARRPSILSQNLEDHMKSALEKGDQVILFLNRRAYSPFLLCRDCGHRFVCKSCAVSLAFHRRELKLKCHQCGHQENVPDECPECSGARIAPFGTGTEKVEEAVRVLFPDANVARLDRDVARRKGALEEILTAFRSRDIQILVGTQMVAKGLDFPHVTVVGVIAADVSLNVPDFRASERTFQLLSQVAGRAGRGQSPGVVVIQTMSPDNGAVLAAQSHDYIGFCEAELAERNLAQYPPYVRLVNVLITGENRQEVIGLSSQVAQTLKNSMEQATILGPVDCPIEKLKNLWRRHVLVKLPPSCPLDAIKDVLALPTSSRARIIVDIDPASLV